ncbi:MAG: family transcriptional regulator [Anaerocolumna sp.]|jgi:putative transcriptional regulator|nr:family transcriptional regulator [Anaerocolumna sp.]
MIVSQNCNKKYNISLIWEGGERLKLNVTKLLIAIGEQQMSIQELAEKSGVSRNTISAIKAGKTCRPDVAGKIARALQKPLAELIED